MSTTMKQLHYRDHSIELHAFESTHDGWHAYGFIGDAEIDTQWCDCHDLSFDELDALILEVMQEEL